MHYLLVFLLLSGCFSAYLAGRRGRRPGVWFAIGLIPAFGVALALSMPPAWETSSRHSAPPAPARRAGEATESARRHRPTRCCGGYIPDCQGCPYFRRPLFSDDMPEGHRGHCDFFDRDLEESHTGSGPTGNSRVTIEDS